MVRAAVVAMVLQETHLRKLGISGLDRRQVEAARVAMVAEVAVVVVGLEDHRSVLSQSDQRSPVSTPVLFTWVRQVSGVQVSVTEGRMDFALSL